MNTITTLTFSHKELAEKYEMNNIPFKQYFWSEMGVKVLDRIFSDI